MENRFLSDTGNFLTTVFERQMRRLRPSKKEKRTGWWERWEKMKILGKMFCGKLEMANGLALRFARRLCQPFQSIPTHFLSFHRAMAKFSFHFLLKFWNGKSHFLGFGHVRVSSETAAYTHTPHTLRVEPKYFSYSSVVATMVYCRGGGIWMT